MDFERKHTTRERITEAIRVGRWYIDDLCQYEYDAQEVRKNERAIEYGFALRTLADVSPNTVLDVGTGISALPQLMAQCGSVVTASDNIVGYWPDGLFNRHFHVINDNITDTKIEHQFDFITCISVLEHIEDYAKAIKGLFDLLNPGGHLVLTFPYNEKGGVDNIYDDPRVDPGMIADCGCRVFTRTDLDSWADAYGQIIDQAYWKIFDGEFWQIGERLEKPRKTQKSKHHHLTCVLMQKKANETTAEPC